MYFFFHFIAKKFSVSALNFITVISKTNLRKIEVYNGLSKHKNENKYFLENKYKINN